MLPWWFMGKSCTKLWTKRTRTNQNNWEISLLGKRLKDLFLNCGLPLIQPRSWCQSIEKRMTLIYNENTKTISVQMIAYHERQTGTQQCNAWLYWQEINCDSKNSLPAYPRSCVHEKSPVSEIVKSVLYLAPLCHFILSGSRFSSWDSI